MKVWNYIFMTITLAIFLTFAGVYVAGTSELLGKFGFSNMTATNINQTGVDSNNTFFNSLFNPSIGLLITLAAGAIIAGLLARTSGENLILISIITGAGIGFGVYTMAGMWYSLINYSKGLPGWAGGITFILLGGLSVGFIFAMAEFLRGTD